jgi:hypothetical protein
MFHASKQTQKKQAELLHGSPLQEESNKLTLVVIINNSRPALSKKIVHEHEHIAISSQKESLRTHTHMREQLLQKLAMQSSKPDEAVASCNNSTLFFMRSEKIYKKFYEKKISFVIIEV